MSSPDDGGPQNPSKGDTVSPEQDQPADGSRVDKTSSHPSPSENKPFTGTETQSQHENEATAGQSNAPAFPLLFDEIRLLQERLLYLEDQASQQWKAAVENAPSEDNRSVSKSKSSDSDDDRVLRKHIRKAPSGRRQVETIEKQAEEGANERKDYGQGPNEAKIGDARSTMHHIRPNGELLQGREFDVLVDKKGWLRTHGQVPTGSHFQESELRQRDRPFPHRGVRPPAAIHPFYQQPVRKGGLWGFKAEPLRLSRKLGPPTKWDESDIEEWSSDTSTRSQDFKYFRSRLRGDFEWELDRLNAQIFRFRKHKDKKKSLKLANRARMDNEKRDEEFGAHHHHDELLAELEIDMEAVSKDKHGIRQLNPLGWSLFRLRRALPLQYSFVIDVLIEEPKLSSDVEPWGRAKREMKTKRIQRTDTNLRAPISEDVNNKDNKSQGFKQSTAWTEQEPLPERIRINSKELIEILTRIHGSSLCRDEDDSTSVVLLRPFRILNAYDQEIRETCARLEETAAKESETSILVQGDRNEQTRPHITTAEDPIGKLKDPQDMDSKSVEEDKEKLTSQEQLSLQLGHLNCLREFMDKYIGTKVAHLNSLSCSKIFFSDVWHLFQPGTTVISANGKQAYRVVSLRSKRHKGADRWAALWTRRNEKKRTRLDRKSDSSDDRTDDTRADITIKCVFIHFDGQSFGPVIQTFRINKWDGEKDVTYLDIYPVRFHVLKHLDKRSIPSTTERPTSVREQEVEEGLQALRRKLVDRGRVFLDVAAMKQMYYSGLAVDTRDEIESQVMVDFEEALAPETRKHWVPNITRLVGTDWNSKTDEADEGCTAECCWQENVHDDEYVETNNTEKFIEDMMAQIRDTPHKLPSAIIFPRSMEEAKTEANAMNDDELMIMSYSVFGFVLRDRTWAKLDLECMSAVRSPGSATEQTDDDLEEGGQGAFGQLVLPPGHKKRMRIFAST